MPDPIKLESIIFADAPSKVDIVKLQSTEGTNWTSDPKVRATTAAIKQRSAMKDRKLKEAVSRLNNIHYLNKWQNFKNNKDSVVIAYVKASNAAKRKMWAFQKLIAMHKLHHAYKCLLEGMK
jgi:propanediol dehydratase large subunit